MAYAVDGATLIFGENLENVVTKGRYLLKSVFNTVHGYYIQISQR